jgi:hypothetical protein
VGLRDVLLGRKKLKDPARERLFAISTARITLENELPIEQDLTRWFGLFDAPL